jgi:hypothetical protein
MPDPELAPFPLWTYDDNATGRGALLSDTIGGPDVAPYAAPARVADHLAYAQRLSEASSDWAPPAQAFPAGSRTVSDGN